MAAKRRHWKEKGGRFWARISVPKNLQAALGKTELIEALGGDLRAADRNHAAAEARLRAQIKQAEDLLERGTAPPAPEIAQRKISAMDHEVAVWNHFNQTLLDDDIKRAAMPTSAEIDIEYERFMQRVEAGEGDPTRDAIGALTLHADYEMKAGARYFDEKIRSRRLAALQSSLASGDTRFIDVAVQQFVEDNKLNIAIGSTEWRELSHRLARAEIQALLMTLGRDAGNFGVQVSDPIVKPPTNPDSCLPPVFIKQLFCDYIAKKQQVGKHRDGGAAWEFQIDSLIKFIGHNDARKLSRRNLSDWRDSLMASGKSPKTVSDKSLAAIHAVLKWAFVEQRLPTNEAAMVRQEVPKKNRSREKGYTTPEALQILKHSIGYQPTKATNPSNRESEHITRAKRWVPLLCAFTGARVSEITQLRKEDIRNEDGRWILRITHEAGSIKSGDYRDVPLHRQILDLGFIEFLNTMKSGPLFHNAQSSERFLAGARATSGRLSEWLQSLGLVPEGVQPSHGWRHRFKTQGRDLGVSDRTLDAIQGHAGKTEGDNYGDATVTARLRVIDALPHYDLGN